MITISFSLIILVSVESGKNSTYRRPQWQIKIVNKKRHTGYGVYRGWGYFAIFVLLPSFLPRTG